MIIDGTNKRKPKVKGNKLDQPNFYKKSKRIRGKVALTQTTKAIKKVVKKVEVKITLPPKNNITIK
jgi:hypothetical protein